MIGGLFGRLLLVMCGVAATSMGLALLLQQRTLSHDLERAAEQRLDAAAVAAERLLEGHLESMAARYRAVSGTPQFRATLEVDDAPTLEHYARSLRDQQGAERIVFADPEGRVVAAAGEAGLDPAALSVRGSDAVAYRGRAHAVVSIPLARAGRVVAVEPIDEPTLALWSELCGARVSFLGPEAHVRTGIERTVRVLDGLHMRVESSLAAEQEALANARLNLAMAGSLGLLVALGMSLVVSRSLVRPIQQVQEAARRIGAGDLGASIAYERRDELGDVARAFGEMTAGLRRTLGEVARATAGVEATAGRVARGSRHFLEISEQQQRGNSEATATLAAIEEQIEGIARAAAESERGLAGALDGSSASFRELAESGKVLEENANRLWRQATGITGSIAEVAADAARVAADADQLLPRVESAASSVQEMSASARAVNAHAQETSRLSRAVVESAESGREIARKAVEGMRATREAIEESERVIQGLHGRAGEIGSILTVIDEVTDETSLLALNAAIIAAQAGERGRAFAVVADHMRALAQRVQASTQEIAGVVRTVQSETRSAVESIVRGSACARDGEGFVELAANSLGGITEAAREGEVRMAESARSTAEQMTASVSIAELIEAVREAAERSLAATRQQAHASEAVQQRSDALDRASEAVSAAVEVQIRGASHIGGTVEAVQRAIRSITKGLHEQGAASREVTEVVRRSAAHTRSHGESAADMGEAARELEREAEALREAVRRFRIGGA